MPWLHFERAERWDDFCIAGYEAEDQDDTPLIGPRAAAVALRVPIQEILRLISETSVRGWSFDCKEPHPCAGVRQVAMRDLVRHYVATGHLTSAEDIERHHRIPPLMEVVQEELERRATMWAGGA